MKEYSVWNDHFKCYLPFLAEYDRYGETTPIVDDGIKALARKLKARNKADYQNVIEINGGTGSGKSTLAIDLCYELDPNWKLEDNYIYTVGDLKKKLKKWETANPISLFDEGSVTLNSLDTTSKSGKDITMLFDTMRCLHWTTIICIPDHKSLNKRVRDFHVDYRLICPNTQLIQGYDKRGFVEVNLVGHSDWGSNYAPHVMTTRFDNISNKKREEYDKIKKEHLMERMMEFAHEEGDED